VAAVARERGLAGPVAVAHLARRTPPALAARHRLRRASPYVPAEVSRAAAASPAPAPTWVVEGSPLRRALLSQSFRSSLPTLLRYADRNSMAHSIEVRLPFLDRRVAEFALSLEPGILYRDGYRKQVLRDAVRGSVPAEVLSRRDKVGYETPEAEWFGSAEGRARIAEILLDGGGRAAAGGLLDRSEIKRDLAAGAWRDVGAVWRAVNAELWLRGHAALPVARVA
jgi:asparagine synthase (glutamine-hydrolysing)